MNQLLSMYAAVFILFLAIALLAIRNDGTLSHNLAKVRVRIDGIRGRNQPDQPDEEEDIGPIRALELLGLSILLLLICLLLSRA